jgi:hypothetical protein
MKYEFNTVSYHFYGQTTGAQPRQFFFQISQPRLFFFQISQPKANFNFQNKKQHFGLF